MPIIICSQVQNVTSMINLPKHFFGKLGRLQRFQNLSVTPDLAYILGRGVQDTRRGISLCGSPGTPAQPSCPPPPQPGWSEPNAVSTQERVRSPLQAVVFFLANKPGARNFTQKGRKREERKQKGRGRARRKKIESSGKKKK